MLGCEGRLLGSWRGRRPVKCEPNNNNNHHQQIHHHVCYVIDIISSSCSSWITHPASNIESLDRSVRNSHTLRWRLGVHLGRTIIMISLCSLSLLSSYLILFYYNHQHGSNEVDNHLWHDCADMEDTLDHGFAGSGHLFHKKWLFSATCMMWLHNVQYMSSVQCTGAYKCIWSECKTKEASLCYCYL